MPTITMNLYAGYRLVKVTNRITDERSFYEGIYSNEFPAIKDADFDIREQNILDYYNDNFKKIDENFLLGTVFHEFLELIWDKKFAIKFTDLPPNFAEYDEKISNYPFFQTEILSKINMDFVISPDKNAKSSTISDEIIEDFVLSSIACFKNNM